MKHAIVPFPFGSREGELVVRVTEVAGEDPVDIAGELRATYRGGHSTSLQEVWLDVGDVAGGGAPNKLGLELRRDWKEIVVTGSVEAESWPWVPVRLLIDMSEYLARPIADRDVWLETISRKIVRNPAPIELYAIAPAPENLQVDILYGLETIAPPEEGCTLYVAEADVERAVLASARAPRPWVVRRLTALPPALRGPAPAASPAS